MSDRDIQTIKQALADIKAKQDTFASKVDIANAETRIIKWNVGTILGVAALVFAILRFIPGV